MREGDADELHDVAAVVLRGAGSLAQRARAERLRDGTTIGMVSALVHLDREGRMTAGRLAALQHTTPQAVTRTLARLRDAGLVERGSNESDRRQARIELTEAGRRRLVDDLEPRVAWLARAMAHLSPTEREVLRLAGLLMESVVRWDDVAGPDGDLPGAAARAGEGTGTGTGGTR